MISAELKNISVLKKYMKKVMPFVQFTKEKVTKLGTDALNLTLDFDEMSVLLDNATYFVNTLDVSKPEALI